MFNFKSNVFKLSIIFFVSMQFTTAQTMSYLFGHVKFLLDRICFKKATAALRAGDTQEALRQIRRMSDVDHEGGCRSIYLTLLHRACRVSNVLVATELMERGANVNSRGFFRKGTPLMFACESGNEQLVRALVERGADVDAEALAGWPPETSRSLHFACQNGVENLVRLFIGQSDIMARDGKNRPPLMCACLSGNENIVEIVIGQGADVNAETNLGRTPLMYACLGDNVRIVEILLESGSDMEARNSQGWTPLMCACQNGSEGVVRVLIERGVAVNVKCKFGLTPVMYACKRDNQNIVEILVDGGANMNARGDRSLHPLLYACRKNCDALARKIIKKGADVNFDHGYRGFTPLMYACQNGNEGLAMMLIENGALIHKTNCFGQTAVDLITDEQQMQRVIKCSEDERAILEQPDAYVLADFICSKSKLMYAKQCVFARLIDYHKKNVRESLLKRLFQEILCNCTFFNEYERFKDVIRFAIEHNLMGKII